MKIETRVETLRWVSCDVTVEEGNSTWGENASVEKTEIGPSPRLRILGGNLDRRHWEAIKKLGDAAWEAWDKTFGDKQPETMGVWRVDENAYTEPSNTGGDLDYSAFVWYPGDKDFRGSAQKALEALQAEKPEWKLELREYNKSASK